MHKEFLKILACPSCKGSLQYDEAEQRLVCNGEKIYYEIAQGGIPILLIDKAKQLTKSDKESS